MTKKLHLFPDFKKSILLAGAVLGCGFAQAQSINVFRLSVIVSTHSTVQAAVAAAAAGDSLVMSPHKFKENNLTISKNLKITGTSDANGMTSIDAESKGRIFYITAGNVVLQDLAIVNGKVNNDAGAGICNYGSGTLTLTGKSSVSNCVCTGIYAKGGGIFSASRVNIAGQTVISNNSASEDGGGVYAYSTISMTGMSKINNNKAGGSGGGIFSVRNGGLNITDSAQIDKNTAVSAGGGIYGVGTLSRYASVTNNTAEFGGGIASFNDALFLNDTVSISNNTATTSGGGIWLNNCNLVAKNYFKIADNKIPAITGTLNFGGAIYNVNGNITINGGIITGNQSPVATIYNTSAADPKAIVINACYIFNPKADGKRMTEVMLSPSLASSSMSFSSNASWWGSTDTSKLVMNRTGTFSGTINNFVELKWHINNSSPLTPGITTFPVTAEFRLNTLGKFDSLTLRTIKATFSATKGSITPGSGMIDKLNMIIATYNANAAGDSTMITAIVDADTFRTGKLGVGPNLRVDNKEMISNIKIYPNPASDLLFISNAKAGTDVRLFNLQGQMVAQQNIDNTVSQINVSSLSAGIYIVQLTDENGQKVSARIVKQ